MDSDLGTPHLVFNIQEESSVRAATNERLRVFADAAEHVHPSPLRRAQVLLDSGSCFRVLHAVHISSFSSEGTSLAKAPFSTAWAIGRLPKSSKHDWIRRVAMLAVAERTDDAIDEIFSAVNSHFMGGTFSACDEALSNLDLDRLDADILIALLSATLPGAVKLKERPRLLSRVESRLRLLAPDRIERLLAGLR